MTVAAKHVAHISMYYLPIALRNVARIAIFTVKARWFYREFGHNWNQTASRCNHNRSSSVSLGLFEEVYCYYISKELELEVQDVVFGRFSTTAYSSGSIQIGVFPHGFEAFGSLLCDDDVFKTPRALQ